MDVTSRFSNRVQDYIRARPGYPPEALDHLCLRMGLGRESAVADIGSGTGILTKPLLERVAVVHAVEPNAPMREAAERLLGGMPGFRSVEGTAESTGLPDASVAGVVAGQAFHWFEPERAREEFLRILEPGGWVALLWNTRDVKSTPFLREYEALLHEYGTDYAQVDHRNIDETVLNRFYRTTPERATFPNRQEFDYEGLQARLLSCSYAPAAGHPRHAPMLEALRCLFDARAEGGTVRFLYDTEIYVGRLGQS